MRTLALLLTLFLATFALADADLSLTVVSRKPQPLTGERVTFDIRLANAGPDAAGHVELRLSESTGRGAFVDVTAPAGWPCGWARHSNQAVCTASSLASGASVVISATVIMPARPEPGLAVGGTVTSTTTPDPNFRNNGTSVALTLTPAPRQADLQIGTGRELVVPEGTDVRHQFLVHNGGPDDASDLFVVIDSAVVPVTAAGAGWTCDDPALHVVCTRASLAAGAFAPIDVRFKAPPHEAMWSISVRPFAELNHDPIAGGSSLAIAVGSRESWRMMLVPLINSGIRGANDSVWNTYLTMLVHSDAPVDMRPNHCELSPVPECDERPRPTRRAFDPVEHRVVAPDPSWPAQYIYIRAAEFDNVQINARISDQSRETQTAGAGIPVPREDAFTSDTITLLNIPVAPEYRHTLRVYDADALDGARVAIRLFANTERTARLTIERTLATPVYSPRLTTARLPSHPAYLQLELGQLMPLDGLESVRVEVEPLDGGVRLWSFVSITNNTTHHVTTVTPQ